MVNGLGDIGLLLVCFINFNGFNDLIYVKMFKFWLNRYSINCIINWFCGKICYRLLVEWFDIF